MGIARGLLAATLAVLGLAACAADRPEPPAVAATTTTAGPDGIRDRILAWEAGRLDPDPRRLVVSFTGADPAADPSDPCWEGYAPEVSAEPERVMVRVRAYRSRTPLGPQQFCADVGYVRTLAVALHDPLAGRAVLDGHNGRRHRLALVPLQPSWLPDGWRLAQELGQIGPGGRDGWERSYGPGPDAGGAAGGVNVSQVTVRDGAASVGQPEGLPWARVVARPAVRGAAGVVERAQGGQELAVRWREGRRGLAVSATFPTDPSELEVAALQRLLLRVARGLR